MKLKLFILFILAFVIRLIAINQSLWLDEATSVMAVKHLNFGEILFNFSPFDFHPPGYYFFLKFWTGIFGFSEMSVRMPSVFASILTGYFVFLIGKKISSLEVGLWATAFYLFNPLAVYYSQEARMYSITVLLLTSLLYLILKGFRNKVLNESYSNDQFSISNYQKSKKHSNYLIITCLVFLSVFTFYGSVLFITSLIIYFLFKKNYQTAFYFITSLFLILLFLSPLLLRQLNNAKSMLNSVTNWKSVLGNADLKNLLLIPLKFTSGRISFFPKIIYYILSGVWTMIISFFIFRGIKKSQFMGWMLLVPIVLGLIISFITPMLQYFRFIYLLPIMAVLISIGVNNRAKFVRIIILIGFIFWSTIYLLTPQFHREDWKSLAYNLPRQAKVYMIISSSDALSYYRPDTHLVDVQSINQLTKLNDRLIIIPYTSEIYGVKYKDTLQDRGYKITKEKSYRGLLIEYWEKI